MIYLLLVAAIVTATLSHWVDTGVILGVVVINAIIGFVQEGKAERALDAIRDLLSPGQASCATADAPPYRRRSGCPETSCCSKRATKCRPTYAC